MIKRTLLGCTAMLLALSGSAAVISPEQALQRAEQTPDGKKRARSAEMPKLAYTEKSAAGEATLYIFNETDNRGFKLVAADDLATPILGYTDTGSFDADNIPPQLQYMIDAYSAEIAEARAAGLQINATEATSIYSPSWQPVTPMLTTRWDQGSPYNRFTPESGTGHCPTGCVATAMAQVMNYWKYPERGEGTITFKSSVGGTLSMNFATQPAFDWDNMLDSYAGKKYTDTEADAVANLMKICGYSVEMDYRAAASGTQGELVGRALKKYFHYSEGITVESRIGYTASAWNELVYNQLSIGPLVYTGTSPEGGHCFIIDGYDGAGYFHVNWGWGGSCNGYYTLNALNPAVQGTGGGYGGYNIGQGIVAGVQPTNAAPSTPGIITLTMEGTISGSMLNGQLNLKLTNTGIARIVNETMETLYPSFGLMFTEEDGSGTPFYIACSSPKVSTDGMQTGTYLNFSNTNFRTTLDSSIPNGKYKVRLVCQPFEGASWRPMNVDPANYDYIMLTKLGSSYKVDNFTPDRFTITNAKITTPLYYANPFLIEMTVTNNSDSELTQFVVPELWIGDVLMLSGENQLVTIGPRQSTTITMSSTFQALSGATLPAVGKSVDYTFALSDLENGTSYGTFGTVSMNRSSSSMSITSRGLNITNAAESGMQDGLGFVYGIDNYLYMTVEQKIEVKNGFIATPLTAIISEYTAEDGAGVQVYEKDFEEMLYLSSGMATVNTVIDFAEFDPHKTYQLAVYYVKGGTRGQLSTIRFAASSGVEDIIEESEVVKMEVYEASGRLAASAAKVDLSSLPKGIYIVRATLANGKTITNKYMK